MELHHNSEFVVERACLWLCEDLIDAAFLRPGRFDKTLYIGLPDTAGRRDILVALSRVSTLS